MKLAGVALKQEAAQKLFDSAAFFADGEELDRIRLHLHALLDERLDHGCWIMTLTRKMLEL